jgi:cytochrome b561
VISGPVIFAGWKMGHDLANMLELESLYDTHQQIGITLLALYVTQLLLGTLIHFVKMPARLFHGHRPPQNYLHVALGLAILALAAYQVRFDCLAWHL